MVFEAHEVQVHAELSNLLLLAQHVWRRLLNARDKDDEKDDLGPSSSSRRPL